MRLATIAAALWLAVFAWAWRGSACAGQQQTGQDWQGYGRTTDETHFSPLARINTGNVGQLSLAWFANIDTGLRSDSQPVEAGGVIYIATGLSIVQAIDGASGQRLWRFDPQAGARAGPRLRPFWGIRGLAYAEGRIFVATADGRLLCLDAKTGRRVWSVMTLEPDTDSTITGAPRVFAGRVVIGSAGGERNMGRGVINCYDARTGTFLWRFFTIPGNPAHGRDSEAMRAAAKTWTGDWWRNSGGGFVWNAITFDAALNRLYIGTGNAGPWNWKIRHPGDNLYTSSIVALDAATGAYVWHYQETPDDAWDFDSAADIELATLSIAGKPKRVILHAPKNGFFYVLDRDTGKLISAEKDETASWADRIDMTTGRPVERPGARYQSGPVVVWPGDFGVHNWQPMSFSPQTGLAYIPMLHMAMAYGDEGMDTTHWMPSRNQWNFGLGATKLAAPAEQFSSSLVAWNPLTQRAAWKLTTPGTFNGGTMATGGGLVFQGHIDGSFNAYDAATGALLWSFPAGVAIMGAPVSYSTGGRQYVSVMSGPPSGAAGSAQKFVWRYTDHARRLLTFALGGKATLPAGPPPAPATPLQDAAFKPDAQTVAHGGALYAANCLTCHGANAIAGGAAPDLRASPAPMSAKDFAAIVRGGLLVQAGMPQFAEFSAGDIDAIRHYIRAEAANGKSR